VLLFGTVLFGEADRTTRVSLLAADWEGDELRRRRSKKRVIH
jgi:hypothetical protein